jgi:hypothetical protein
MAYSIILSWSRLEDTWFEKKDHGNDAFGLVLPQASGRQLKRYQP